jgi:hypothetical protein
MILAPAFLASFARAEIQRGGTWVISIPGSTKSPYAAETFPQTWETLERMKSKLE